jgi:N5-(cytidine 5'-diphosphoramidyl)-L-glutamine hydrolase
MTPVLIGITQRVVSVPGRNEKRDALDQAWFSFLRECGLEPVIIPNLHSDIVNYVKRLGVKGVILTGGNNFSNKLVGHLFQDLNDTAQERDEIEIALLEASLENCWPILGVCRGMQLMNIFHGGKLSFVEGHVGELHSILKKTENISVNYAFDPFVNSYHDLGILDSDIAEGMEILAQTDNVIEAIRTHNYNHLGIMWHPERNIPPSYNDIFLFRQFFLNND